MKWKEKKQAEKIKVGDWVERYGKTFIVTRIVDSDTLNMIGINGACYNGINPSECIKLNKPNVADKLQALFSEGE